MTRPTQNLPPEYTPACSINLAKNIKLTIGLNLAGLVLMVLVFWLSGQYTLAVRADIANQGNVSFDMAWVLLMGLGLVIGMLVVHEAIHGIFFWVFTHARPVFGLGLTYAYAAAPGWYIPLRPYLWIGLSPLVLMGLAGLLVITWGPASWVLPAMALVAFNTGGAIGDLWIITRLLMMRSEAVLVNDGGHAVTFYVPLK